MAAGYFSGKKAVITGAGDGIGRALAQQLNAMGCELWLCDVDSGRLEATLEGLDVVKAAVHTEVVDCGNQDAIVAWGEQWLPKPLVSTPFLITQGLPMLRLLPTPARRVFSG